MASIFYDFIKEDRLEDRYRFWSEYEDRGKPYGSDIWMENIQLINEFMDGSSSNMNSDSIEFGGSIFSNEVVKMMHFSHDAWETAQRLLSRLKMGRDQFPEPICPRLFVSHKQEDSPYAMRIAELAFKHGFDVWVDVLDPNLSQLGTHPETMKKVYPLIIAAIIELALINSTHVVACITKKSKYSQWIPYEFGRVKNPQQPERAMSWVKSYLQLTAIPEYMHLGLICKKEYELERWLAHEVSKWNNSECARRTRSIPGGPYPSLNSLV